MFSGLSRVRRAKNPSTAPSRRGPVVYWMQAAQRLDHNAALDQARSEARRRGTGLRVVFVLVPAFGVAALRSYWFMVEGLRELAAEARKRGLSWSCYRGEPGEVIPRYLEAVDASLLVMDGAVLRTPRQWRDRLFATLDREVVEVDTETVVPLGRAYPKAAWSAAALRPHLRRLVPLWLEEPASNSPGPLAAEAHAVVPVEGLEAVDLEGLGSPADLVRLLPGLDATPGPSPVFHGGHREARKHLDLFAEVRGRRYGEARNDPGLEVQSNLSPYLHFGQISVQEVIGSVLSEEEFEGVRTGRLPLFRKEAPSTPWDDFLEELVVRRELAFNYVWYEADYDRYQALPAWARQTLGAHGADPRPWIYTREELEAGQTHDPAWNACQREMRETGKMHGYMRMYWGKKIIEWSPDPETAFNTALWLNDRWELDGRDPNGYAGVAWCFGLHDRPWAERSVFGTVRYMNEAGLRRKFRMEPYLERWNGKAGELF